MDHALPPQNLKTATRTRLGLARAVRGRYSPVGAFWGTTGRVPGFQKKFPWRMRIRRRQASPGPLLGPIACPCCLPSIAWTLPFTFLCPRANNSLWVHGYSLASLNSKLLQRIVRSQPLSRCPLRRSLLTIINIDLFPNCSPSFAAKLRGFAMISPIFTLAGNQGLTTAPSPSQGPPASLFLHIPLPLSLASTLLCFFPRCRRVFPVRKHFFSFPCTH